MPEQNTSNEHKPPGMTLSQAAEKYGKAVEDVVAAVKAKQLGGTKIAGVIYTTDADVKRWLEAPPPGLDNPATLGAYLKQLEQRIAAIEAASRSGPPAVDKPPRNKP